MALFNKIERNPFQPDGAVEPERLVGREEEIRDGKRLIAEVIKGRTAAIRIVGEPGVGKTSLANYLYFLYEDTADPNDSNPINVDYLYVDISAVDNFEDFVFLMQFQLATSIRKKGLWSKYEKLFIGLGKYFMDVITRQQTVNINVEISESAKSRNLAGDPKILKDNLREYTKTRVEEGKSALLLILDNINGLVEDERFPRFLKGMKEEFEREDKGLPFCLILCAIGKRWEVMVRKHKPVARIFTEQFDLKPLKDTHVKKFFFDRFSDHGISLEENVLPRLVEYTEGVPMNMQRIGYEVFGYVEGGRVSESIAIRGIISAAKKLSSSLFLAEESTTSLFDKVLSSDQRLEVAQSVLWKGRKITRGLLEEEFAGSALNNFIKYMTENKVIKPCDETRTGYYEFTSRIMQYLFLRRVQEEIQREKKVENPVDDLLDFIE